MKCGTRTMTKRNLGWIGKDLWSLVFGLGLEWMISKLRAKPPNQNSERSVWLALGFVFVMNVSVALLNRSDSVWYLACDVRSLRSPF